MTKPEKSKPTAKLTKKQAQDLKVTKRNNAIEGYGDRANGRDTRMLRDGGTNRRLRK